LKLKVAMDASNIEDLPSDPEDVFPEYDEFTRTGRQPERGPFEDYIVSCRVVLLYFMPCLSRLKSNVVKFTGSTTWKVC
jgi:hypothetical protein